MKKLLFTLSLLLALPAWAGDPAALFPVSYHEAEDAVSQALNAKGAGTAVQATMIGNKSEALYSYSKPLTVQVKGVQFDKQSSRWSASLLFVADGEVVTAMPATGHFDEMVSVPVLKRSLRNGDVISDADIDMRSFPVSQTRSDTVGAAEGLIGKTPVHSVSPNRPVRLAEIAPPPIVKKDSVVQMRYITPGMEITTLGQAMGQGAKGDVIDVRNNASKRIVRATIQDENTVSVMPSGAQSSQVTGNTYVAN